jgi:hypothetical protein
MPLMDITLRVAVPELAQRALATINADPNGWPSREHVEAALQDAVVKFLERWEQVGDHLSKTGRLMDASTTPERLHDALTESR